MIGEIHQMVRSVDDAEMHSLTHMSVYRLGKSIYDVHTRRFGTDGHQVLGETEDGQIRVVLTPDAANILWTDAWFIATGLHIKYIDDRHVRDEAVKACEMFTKVYDHISRYDGRT